MPRKREDASTSGYGLASGTAFVVLEEKVEEDGDKNVLCYVAARIEMSKGIVISITRTHEPSRFKSLAFELLSGDVMDHYVSQTIKDSTKARAPTETKTEVAP